MTLLDVAMHTGFSSKMCAFLGASCLHLLFRCVAFCASTDKLGRCHSQAQFSDGFTHRSSHYVHISAVHESRGQNFRVSLSVHENGNQVPLSECTFEVIKPHVDGRLLLFDFQRQARDDKDVFLDQQRRFGDRRCSETVIVFATNHADERLGSFTF